MAGRLPTDEAKFALAEIWFEQISDVIPVGKLSECYRIAKQNHTGSFAINAYDLLDAMKEITPCGPSLEEIRKQREIGLTPPPPPTI